MILNLKLRTKVEGHCPDETAVDDVWKDRNKSIFVLIITPGVCTNVYRVVAFIRTGGRMKWGEIINQVKTIDRGMWEIRDRREGLETYNVLPSLKEWQRSDKKRLCFISH